MSRTTMRCEREYSEDLQPRSSNEVQATSAFTLRSRRPLPVKELGGLKAISTTNAFILNNSTLQGIALSNNQVLWSFAGDGTLTNAPATGLSAGDGLLIVPAGNKVIAYVLSTNP